MSAQHSIVENKIIWAEGYPRYWQDGTVATDFNTPSNAVQKTIGPLTQVLELPNTEYNIIAVLTIEKGAVVRDIITKVEKKKSK